MPFSIILLCDNDNCVNFRLPNGTSKKSTCFTITYIEKPWILIRRRMHGLRIILTRIVFTLHKVAFTSLTFLLKHIQFQEIQTMIFDTLVTIFIIHITGDAWDGHFFIIVLCNYGTLGHNIVKGYSRFTKNNFRCT